MATLDWHHSRRGGVTLVELLVRSEREARIRIESRLTPVWPPRRQGVPAAGWEENSFETTVEAGERLVVGYASPAEPEGQPAELAEPEGTTATAVEPRTLVRALGEAKPPRDLVPDSDRQIPDGPDAAGEPRDAGNGPETTPRGPPAGALEAWFEAVEGRLSEAERLADIESAQQATAAVTAAGGIEGIERLQAQLAADHERLERIADRKRRLSERIRAVDIPTGALERLA